MTVITRIKENRLSSLCKEIKSKLLDALERELSHRDHVVIGCGSHFRDPKWEFDSNLECPYLDRAAVVDFLRINGFHVRDYINGFGVNYGIEVSI